MGASDTAADLDETLQQMWEAKNTKRGEAGLGSLCRRTRCQPYCRVPQGASICRATREQRGNGAIVKAPSQI